MIAADDDMADKSTGCAAYQAFVTLCGAISCFIIHIITAAADDKDWVQLSAGCKLVQITVKLCCHCCMLFCRDQTNLGSTGRDVLRRFYLIANFANICIQIIQLFAFCIVDARGFTVYT